MTRQGTLANGNIATQMMLLGYEVYNPDYLISSLGVFAEPLAYELPAGSEPNEAAVATGAGWHAVSAMEFGIAPAVIVPDPDDPVQYSFANGLYQAAATATTGEADALVLLGKVGGVVTLSVTFRGTDDKRDFAFYPNFRTYYDRFSPLVAAIKTYLKDPGHGVKQVLVSANGLAPRQWNTLSMT